MKYISPVFNIPSFVDADGNPLAGGLIFAYEGGSFSVLKNTYTSEDGAVANSNPVVLNSAGQLTTSIFLNPGETYNLVLTEADGTTVIKNFDGVVGVTPPAPEQEDSSLWVTIGPATYLTPTSFRVDGNFTSELTLGARVRFTSSSVLTYATVTSSTFVSTYTEVLVDNDGAVLTSALDSVEYSLLGPVAKVVDAGAVRYVEGLYTTGNSVGAKVQNLDETLTASIDNTEALRDRGMSLWSTSGANTYTLSPSPAFTTYSDVVELPVKFVDAAVLPIGSLTMNINGLGAKNIRIYDSTGAKLTPATLPAGFICSLTYDGTDLVISGQLPFPPVLPTRGWSYYTTNGTFTVPAQVTSVKVTCLAGGGGGSYDTGGGSYAGGRGGVAVNYISVTPGLTYDISVGAGGLGGTNISPNGQAGGSSSFGVSLVLATGGQGGTTTGPGAGGASTAGFALGAPQLATVFGNGGEPMTPGLPPANSGQSGFVWVEY